MNDKIVAKKLNNGDGVYCLTKKAAGEAHKAAKAYKMDGEVTYWRRKRGKASK